MQRTVLAVTILAFLAGAAMADSVRTTAGIGHSGSIVGLDGANLVVEREGRRTTVALPEVATVEADRWPDLTKAEARAHDALSGDQVDRKALKTAEDTYLAVLEKSPPAWVRALVNRRLVNIYTETNRSGSAAEAWLELAEVSPEAAAEISVPKPRVSERAARALLQRVEKALARAAGKPHEAGLRRIKALLSVDVGDPAEGLKAVRAVKRGAEPEVRRWAIMKEIGLLLDLGRVEEAERTLAQAVKVATRADAVRLVFYRARILAERNAHEDAALLFMRLPVLRPDDDRSLTAEALYRAGQVMAAAGYPKDEINKVYTEAVETYPGTEGARKASEALK